MSQPALQNIMTDKRLSIAPMIDWTTTDYRFFARLFNPHTYLYTEMISTGAIIHGNTDRLLRFDTSEHPLVLQLGGADISEMTQCAIEAQKRGFDEVNINVGCPSDRVQHNKIGACLMAEPDTVASLVRHMQAEIDIPVTVKHRIGIDEYDSYQFMKDFVDASAEAGCERFIVHARIAWLKGLSPKENREIPPLRYDDVYRLKQEMPELKIEINAADLYIKEGDEFSVESNLKNYNRSAIWRSGFFVKKGIHIKANAVNNISRERKPSARRTVSDRTYASGVLRAQLI